jgi:hypothetical protein
MPARVIDASISKTTPGSLDRDRRRAPQTLIVSRNVEQRLPSAHLAPVAAAR